MAREWPDSPTAQKASKDEDRGQAYDLGSTTSFVERVTGIEPALSAWEAVRLRLFRALTWRFPWSGVTVTDP
jgi:hypothetical protein